MRLISADSIKYSSNGCFHPYCKDVSCDNCCHAVVRKNEIDSMSTIDAEPVKHGHWINAGHDEWNHYFRCSVCGRLIVNISKTNYCPNCGAKMDEMEK